MNNNNNRDYTVKTIEEYINTLKHIQSIEQKPLWYRGQMKSSWHLDPTLYRNNLCYETSDHYGNTITPVLRTYRERGQEVRFPDQFYILEAFKKEIIDNELAPSSKMNDIEWLCFAQHCSMPTSLLDWSEDPMVGLFFAIDGIQIDESNTEEEARVYILNPYIYNRNYCNCRVKDKDGNEIGLPEPLPVNDSLNQFLMEYSRNDINPPICIKPRKIGYRMCRQSGNFLLYSSFIKPLDNYSSDVVNTFMYTIHIPYSEVSYFSSCLNALNLNKSSIYGDETGLDEAGRMAREKGEKQIKEIVETIKRELLFNSQQDL